MNCEIFQLNRVLNAQIDYKTANWVENTRTDGQCTKTNETPFATKRVAHTKSQTLNRFKL